MTIEIKSNDEENVYEDNLEIERQFALGNKTSYAKLTFIGEQSSTIVGFHIDRSGFHFIRQKYNEVFDEPNLKIKVPLGWVACVNEKPIPEGEIFLKKGQSAEIHKVVIPFGIIVKKTEASLKYE